MDLFVQLVPKAETLVYHLLRNACLEIKQDIGHITEYKLVWVMTCENTFFQMVPRKKNQKSETQWNNNNNNNNRLIQQLQICSSSPVEWKSFIAATWKIIIQCVSYWSWVYAINQQRDKIKENNAVCIFVAKILRYLIATDNSPHDQKTTTYAQESSSVTTVYSTQNLYGHPKLTYVLSWWFFFFRSLNYNTEKFIYSFDSVIGHGFKAVILSRPFLVI